MKERNVFTIGFTKKSAEDFFDRLREAGIRRVVDVRLNNSSQLAGFSKRDDLRYFLEKILRVEYVAEPLFAPTPEMLDRYRKNGRDWKRYEREFLDLLAQRKVERKVAPEMLEGGCLLCSEDQPHQCHRRLVAEYLREQWGNLNIQHL